MTYEDNDPLQANWPDNRARVKQKWNQLTDNDLTSVNGKCDHLIARLQERYGYSRERAEQECQAFLDELENTSSASERQLGSTNPGRNEDR